MTANDTDDVILMEVAELSNILFDEILILGNTVIIEFTNRPSFTAELSHTLIAMNFNATL